MPREIPSNCEVKISDICLIRHRDNKIEAPEVEKLSYEPFEQGDYSYEVTSYSKHEASILNDNQEREGTYMVPLFVTIKDTVFTITGIGEWAYASQKFTSLIIPPFIKKIGRYAFLNCSSLREVHSVSAEAPDVANGAFEGVSTNHAILYVPFGSQDNYAFATGWRDFVNIEEEETPIEYINDLTLPTTSAKLLPTYSISGMCLPSPVHGLCVINGHVVWVDASNR